MKEIDLSIKDEYYSQINNKYIPLSSCMRTSEVMFLLYNGVRFIEAGNFNSQDNSKHFIIYPKGMQPEDYLTALCESPWGYELRNALPWAEKDKTPPGQVHQILSEIVNRMIGTPVDVYSFTKDITIVYNEIRNGRCVMTSGQFTKSGHAVCVCGMRYDENTNEVSDILIDDPYGDYFSNYKNPNGNNIWFPVLEFMKLWSGNIHRYIGD